MVRRKFPSSGEASFLLYHSDFAAVKITLPREGKRRAELRVKYFCAIKISTSLLIRLWKSAIRSPLTSRPSTLFSSLHYLSATLFFTRALVRRKILRPQENNSVEEFQRGNQRNTFVRIP